MKKNNSRKIKRVTIVSLLILMTLTFSGIFSTVSAAPGPPTAFTATVSSRAAIDLAWTRDTENLTCVVKWASTEGPWSVTEGTEIYNGTAALYTHSELTFNTQYFYQIWAYNATNNEFSATNLSDNATTTDNNVATQSSASPSTCASVSDSQRLLQITIADPEGNATDWTITTSPNIGSSSGTDEANGTKECVIYGLDGSTTYIWTVSVWDDFEWTNASYTFSTSVAQSYPYNPPAEIDEVEPDDVKPFSTPSFELMTLIGAIGISVIVLRKKIKIKF
jgi:hypothetical protein